MTSNRRTVRRRVIAFAFVFGVVAANSLAALAEARPKSTPNHEVSGPFTYQNLAVYLIHGKDVIQHKKILTLQEALQQKKIIVHETGSVRQLEVENLSVEAEVFIQAGDIVKGGRQDRVLAYDLMVPPKSGRVSIASFCVEAGRWRRRGSEDSAKFSKSTGQLPGKALRLAISSSGQQQLVWKRVKEQQDKLSQRLKKMVASAQSPSSLQLTLENKDLQAKVNAYVKRLEKCTAGKKDVVGFAVTINGKVESADLYGSSTLFRKMWPKLLRSAAVYAFAEQTISRRFEMAETEQISSFLADGKGDPSVTKVNDRIHVMTHTSSMKISIRTRDQLHNGAILHRNDLAR